MTASDDIFQHALNLQVKIRKLRREDLRKLEWFGLFSHYRRLFLRSYYGQRDGNRLLLVADLKGFPIGRLFIQFGDRKSQLSDGVEKAYLYSFHVFELFQGQGIGTKLIHIAEAILWQRRFRIATIAVVKENAGALRLYQREGYTIFGENEGNWSYTDQHGILHEVHEPCWLLEKHLTPP